MLKKLERTKNLEISEKLNGKLQSLTSFISTNYVRPTITSESRQIRSIYKDLNFLKKIDSKVYLAEKEPILISFLKGIVSKSHCNQLLTLLKLLYLARKQWPLSMVRFCQGLVIPVIYWKWVSENRREKNGVPYCDLDVCIDNIGKYIIKKYRVHSERNNSPTVVTAVINIELQQNKADAKNIQFMENLKLVIGRELLPKKQFNVWWKRKLKMHAITFENTVIVISAAFFSFYHHQMIWRI